ncbi:MULTISPECIES: TetR/AcrR family transcriptional regulator [Mycobacteriaceae]|uniref:TetR/AcrR family transcriptional regulator n=1 Tax=Mycolicibacterium parafortuitum TaxID=39692 RepID=A0ACC6MDH9_MYCPF|nr:MULTISPECIES: TetR/AcrR family transcriptional regulator [Mycobacteriaceae]MBX7452403.1 TetR/AcrR family transcriptional regulator [Mycolicibacterium aurantiacum]MDZ5085016.1 TetR/AcrR family transcriptional regulator [Mycolicibacterium parafortuitum]GFM18422.1 TetR family transcriptional regulator [Mycobacterium sp. PO1]GFM21940.1 TetR family transcriptional regulator [Mycobacterium sp. PO2]
MVSIRKSPQSVEARILDAAAACILAYGVERTTLTEIARRARVSRPTIYRRWPDIRWVIAELLTLRIAGVLDAVPDAGAGREAMVARVVAVAQHLRGDDVVMSVIHNAPNIAITYITSRLGTSQQILVDALAEAIKSGQSEGSIRTGDAHQMAAMCLLITQSTIQSAQMVADLLDADSLDTELAHSLNGYLKP